eukprot:5455705-Amphidinium_carterae.1
MGGGIPGRMPPGAPLPKLDPKPVFGAKAPPSGLAPIAGFLAWPGNAPSGGKGGPGANGGGIVAILVAPLSPEISTVADA